MLDLSFVQQALVYVEFAEPTANAMEMRQRFGERKIYRAQSTYTMCLTRLAEWGLIEKVALVKVRCGRLFHYQLTQHGRDHLAKLRAAIQPWEKKHD